MTRPAFAKWLSDTNDVTQVFLSAGQIPDLINMGGGLPEPSVWPVEELASLSAEAIRDHPSEALAYSPIDGLPALRDAIAARFSTDGLSLTRENVLVTTAGMQALDLIGKVLLEEGRADRRPDARLSGGLGCLAAAPPALPPDAARGQGLRSDRRASGCPIRLHRAELLEPVGPAGRARGAPGAGGRRPRHRHLAGRGRSLWCPLL